ncbi:MAG: hypothetical protein IIB72_00405 [Proteobacteria bacterium]|nr:hypothetical protein [Pseudomonadota bacterium]
MTENEFLSAIRLHLDKSIAQLDVDIVLRLDSMREQALDPSEKVVVALDELQDARATDKLVQTIRTNLEHSASVPPEIEVLLEAAIRAEQNENSNENRNDNAHPQQRNNR